MKKFGWILMAAAAGALLLARPAMAEVTAGPEVQEAAAVPQQSAMIVSQAPPGDEGTVLSPVIVAGQGGSQGEAGPQGAVGMQSDGSGAPQEAAAGTQSDVSGTQSDGLGTPQEIAGAQQSEASVSQSPVVLQGAGAQPSDGENQPGGLLYPVGEEPADGSGQEAAGETSGGRQIDPSRPMVALTFDDGPQPSVGNRIMDCLAQYGGKATFFMVGDRVPSHADEVRRMAAEGHEVANHTMNHKYLQKLGAAGIQSQVTQCNDVIESVCGVRPTLMRLPGGNHNAAVLANTNMPMIQWSIDTLDWKTRNAQSTVSAVLDHVRDGDIILMHELYSQTGDAALTIIPELVNRGYQLVTVSEMAAAKGQALQAGKLYSSFH